jgi:hypothetical protein
MSNNRPGRVMFAGYCPLRSWWFALGRKIGAWMVPRSTITSVGDHQLRTGKWKSRSWGTYAPHFIKFRPQNCENTGLASSNYFTKNADSNWCNCLTECRRLWYQNERTPKWNILTKRKSAKLFLNSQIVIGTVFFVSLM